MISSGPSKSRKKVKKRGKVLKKSQRGGKKRKPYTFGRLNVEL